jgi:hypothetical protein
LNPQHCCEKINPPIFDSEAHVLYQQINAELKAQSHPSGLFDQRHRPFEPFFIQGAITEIILGPRFTATLPYYDYLRKQPYRVIQLGVERFHT